MINFSEVHTSDDISGFAWFRNLFYTFDLAYEETLRATTHTSFEMFFSFKVDPDIKIIYRSWYGVPHVFIFVVTAFLFSYVVLRVLLKLFNVIFCCKVNQETEIYNQLYPEKKKNAPGLQRQPHCGKCLISTRSNLPSWLYSILRIFFCCVKNADYIELSHQEFTKETSMEEVIMRMRYYEKFIKTQLGEKQWQDLVKEVQEDYYEVQKGDGNEKRLVKKSDQGRSSLKYQVNSPKRVSINVDG